MTDDEIKALAAQLPVGLTKSNFRNLCQKLWKHRPRGTLRLKRKARSGTISNNRSVTEEEKNTRNKRGALAERELLQSKQPSLWNTLSLLGLFYFEYNRWCLAEYRHGSFATHYALMTDLVGREGSAQVHAGIVTLFRGKPLDWVTRKELEFLTDPSKWSRFVAPAIVQSRKSSSRGEQSEWEGSTGEGVVVRRRK